MELYNRRPGQSIEEAFNEGNKIGIKQLDPEVPLLNRVLIQPLLSIKADDYFLVDIFVKKRLRPESKEYFYFARERERYYTNEFGERLLDNVNDGELGLYYRNPTNNQISCELLLSFGAINYLINTFAERGETGIKQELSQRYLSRSMAF